MHYSIFITTQMCIHFGSSVSNISTAKLVLSGHSKRTPKLGFNTNYHLIQVKSIAECSHEHSAILSTFMKLPFSTKAFVLSIVKWPFTVRKRSLLWIVKLSALVSIQYHMLYYTTLTNFSTIYLVMCKVYTDVCGIK